MFANLRLTVNVFPLFSPEIFFKINIFNNYGLKFFNFYA